MGGNEERNGSLLTFSPTDPSIWIYGRVPKIVAKYFPYATFRTMQRGVCSFDWPSGLSLKIALQNSSVILSFDLPSTFTPRSLASTITTSQAISRASSRATFSGSAGPNFAYVLEGGSV